MAEFKKLSEVDVINTASDNATVLIEEGGEIKRVSKKEVGGAGGYVIRLGDGTFTAIEYGYECYENYDELYDILMAGGSVWIDEENAPEYSAPAPMSLNNITNWGPSKYLVRGWQLTDCGLVLYDLYDNFTIYFPNGSHNLEHNY